MKNVINLGAVTSNGEIKNLSGKERGEDVRKLFQLDSLDEEPTPIKVIVPDYIYAISSSFFLGLFSKSVLSRGSADKFLDHYQFEADAAIMKQVAHAINRCLMPRSAPPSLN